MNMREIATGYRLSHWAQIVRARTESGLSIKAYCESEGIRPSQYFYWQRRLREAAVKDLSAAQKEMAVVPPGSFAEVRISDPLSLPGEVQPSPLQIEVSGIRIMADSTYPLEKLALLIRELKDSC